MPSPTPGGGSPRTPRQPGKPIVDRFGGNRRKLGDVRPLPVKPGKGNGKVRIQPMPVPGKGRGARPLPIDERIVRTMPITEKQLGQIKKMYGV
jgi:hypothetical protein